MLFHVSVEADDPQLVAKALAEIWGGEAFPFPQVGVGSWVALAGDAQGTLIEVYRRGTELHESIGREGAHDEQGAARRNGATHLAIGTRLTPTAIFAIAERNGWSAQYCRRSDVFGLIEIWIEGCLMVEVLTPEMQREYVDVVTIDNMRRMIEAGNISKPNISQAA